MGEAGVEPACHKAQILSLLCIPIPPLALVGIHSQLTLQRIHIKAPAYRDSSSQFVKQLKLGLINCILKQRNKPIRLGGCLLS